MADNVFTLVFPAIFVAILLLVGVVIFGYSADVMSDKWFPNEHVLDATGGVGCAGILNASSGSWSCIRHLANTPIENITRAPPVVENCTFPGWNSCVTMTAGTHYIYNKANGSIWIINKNYNGSIKVSYWQDKVTNTQDTNQQSLTGTVFSGFNLGMILVIVLAAAGIMSTILLVGRND